MRLDVRVEPRPRTVHRELADESVGGEQVQGVVDGGLRDTRAGCTQLGEDLLGGQVLGRREQQRRNTYPLGGGSYAAFGEAPFGSVTGAGGGRRDAGFHGGGL